MPRYVDGFVIPVPKKNLEDYRRIAELCAKVWREHGRWRWWSASPRT
jgi:uncharacterized protein YbaA (DUF1428 family)